MTIEEKGVIEKARFGGHRPFGLRVDVKLENGNGVTWIEYDLQKIEQFLRDTGVEYVHELVGTPVECIMDGEGAGSIILECKDFLIKAVDATTGEPIEGAYATVRPVHPQPFEEILAKDFLLRVAKEPVAVPAYTAENPQPFEEILERFAPTQMLRYISVHKEDGTICVLPWCKDEHDEYEIVYERKAVKKVVVNE